MAAIQKLLGEGGPTLVWVALALVVEAVFYFSIAWARGRDWWRPARLALLAPVSYLVYALPLGVANPLAAAAILAMAGALAYWFRIVPRSRWGQAGLLILFGLPVLFKLFPVLYPRAGEFRLDILGQLMWIRVLMLTFLREIDPEGLNFGFWPAKRDWKVGAQHFCILLPVVFGLTELSGFAHFTVPVWPWYETLGRALGFFLGILFVTALYEEFIFRGLLQRWLGVWVASALFGAVHLGFREFPNWKFALIAAVTGLFYGRAFVRGEGIRAAMVAHALTVMVWKTLFR